MLMGDKVQARNSVQPLGVPTVPGTEGPIQSVTAALIVRGGSWLSGCG